MPFLIDKLPFPGVFFWGGGIFFVIWHDIVYIQQSWAVRNIIHLFRELLYAFVLLCASLNIKYSECANAKLYRKVSYTRKLTYCGVKLQYS